MNIALAELARMVGGRILGDGDRVIHGAHVLEQAGPGDITLVDCIERLGHLADSQAAAAVVPEDRAIENLPDGPTLLVVDNLHQAFTTIVARFRTFHRLPRTGVSSQAIVDPTASLADDVDVHAGAIIGPHVEIGTGATIHAGVHVMAGCRIGEQVTLMPGVVLYDNTRVGSRTLIHAGAVIGAFGFGYQMVDGSHQRTAQLGHVEIGTDVEIGANTTIDRGTYGATVVGEGTKIDNLVMIGHNCHIGRHNMICSQVGIAGSTSTGDYVVMAGQVGVRDHVHIGTGAVLGAMAGISNDVAEQTCVFGAPATPEREQKIKQAALAKLPQMRREFRILQRLVKKLIEQQSPPQTDVGDQAAA